MSRNPEYIKLINTYRWQMLRLSKLSADPLCERCRKEGRLTPADQVHHIIPIESARDFETMKRLTYDRANLMSLCRDCHRLTHIEMSTRRRRGFSRKTNRQMTDEYLERIKKKFNI